MMMMRREETNRLIQTKKFERIAESNFSWSLGLSRDAELNSTCFWRLELEVQRAYNSIVLIASRLDYLLTEREGTKCKGREGTERGPLE